METLYVTLRVYRSQYTAKATARSASTQGTIGDSVHWLLAKVAAGFRSRRYAWLTVAVIGSQILSCFNLTIETPHTSVDSHLCT